MNPEAAFIQSLERLVVPSRLGLPHAKRLQMTLDNFRAEKRRLEFEIEKINVQIALLQRLEEETPLNPPGAGELGGAK